MEKNDQARYEWMSLRCQAGEPGAFEDLVAVMERPLLYYATSLLGNPDVALDVMQDAWIRIFRGIRKLRDPGALRPWLYSIVHGIAIDHMRKDRSREGAERFQFQDFNEAEEPSFAEVDGAALHHALSEIDFKHREVLVLHFLEDLSMAEIATVIGCAEDTVKSRIHYAKRAIKEMLKGSGYGKGK